MCSFSRDAEPVASLQKALSGENFMEKERRLSEMILQLQMVREQLLSQQQHQQHQQQQPEQSRVSTIMNNNDMCCCT